MKDTSPDIAGGHWDQAGTAGERRLNEHDRELPHPGI
jgi:hypothetical protein